jgi:uncharacterized protein YuzE
MKVMYHPDRDGLRILFSDAPIERSTSEVSGLILDYDNNGVVVGLELTQASERMPNPRLVEFAEIPALNDSSDPIDGD